MDKMDYKKQLKEIYSASAKQCSIVTVPKMNFLMMDGKGDPNQSVEFQAAIQALFSVSYTIKFMLKKSQKMDYGVLPLEGLWWCDPIENFHIEKKDLWQWTLMMMQPECVNQEIYHEAAEKVRHEKKLLSINELRFEGYDEGLAVQILHVGPFSAEGPTVDKLHEFIAASGYQLNNKHHEIYLSDTRCSNPQNWKTIIRQPIFKNEE
ncbi:hypothetical protein Ga0466249_001056 [Sporomusaceae bacterium BoRhaA]|uniref:GyrI-like domain-containing protein n=1 Tax=Pelorhabdus rhamnosifermentans TaxID=2772457 RepID=UPI001C06406D|nr:GyrI-like domain-containing protein [Pelorhabdus rhamnosifermentans]MBU2699964.1 hypothetical protein [Pelorhabdus rhamnosifermentans]